MFTLRTSLHTFRLSNSPLSGSANPYLQCTRTMPCENTVWVNFHSPWWQAAYSSDKMLCSELSSGNLTPPLLSNWATSHRLHFPEFLDIRCAVWVSSSQWLASWNTAYNHAMNMIWSEGCDFSCWFLTVSLRIHFDCWSCVGHHEQISGSQKSNDILEGAWILQSSSWLCSALYSLSNTVEPCCLSFRYFKNRFMHIYV